MRNQPVTITGFGTMGPGGSEARQRTGPCEESISLFTANLLMYSYEITRIRRDEEKTSHDGQAGVDHDDWLVYLHDNQSSRTNAQRRVRVPE